MDTAARHCIAIRIIQDVSPDALNEGYVLARMIRTGSASRSACIYYAFSVECLRRDWPKLLGSKRTKAAQTDKVN